MGTFLAFVIGLGLGMLVGGVLTWLYARVVIAKVRDTLGGLSS